MQQKRGRIQSTWLDDLSQFAIIRPAQLKEKSGQWFDDAKLLYVHKRYAATIYLGGFVVELLLKAGLWERRSEPEIAALLGRSHDLALLLSSMPVVADEIQKPEWDVVRVGFEHLSSWSVKVRYNPKKPSSSDARQYWRQLSEVRKWLIGRI